MVLGGIGFTSSAVAKEATEQPYNVLFIAVDDLNDWIGPYGGHPQAVTPNLDKLAKNAVTFTNAQCAASVCNPSRAALMTGVRPSTSGVYQNNHLFRNSQVLKDALTIPQYFSDNGYFTTAKGKIFHHPQGIWGDEESWDVHVKTSGKGMNKHKDQTADMLANGMPYANTHQKGMDWGVIENITTEESSDYQSALWATQELEKKHSKPFFIACGIFRPHLPWFLPQKYYDKFKLEDIQLPEIKEDDLNDIPPVGKRMSGGLDAKNDYQRIKKYKKQKEAVRAYLASTMYADECVGMILDALENSPYKDNTIVVLFGDHGWHLGEKLHYRKYVLWEESCRVPFIMKVPGLGEGGAQKCARPVNLLDIYPTLVDLCGLPAKKELEGRSIATLIENTNAKWEYPSLTTMGENRHSIRSERYRYIRYEDGTEELYDHKNDPMEWTNLAKDKKYKKVISNLAKWVPKVNTPAIKATAKHK